MSNLERLLADLASGNDDDRSVADSCRYELEQLRAELNKSKRLHIEAENAHDKQCAALKSEIEVWKIKARPNARYIDPNNLEVGGVLASKWITVGHELKAWTGIDDPVEAVREARGLDYSMRKLCGIKLAEIVQRPVPMREHLEALLLVPDEDHSK